MALYLLEGPTTEPVTLVSVKAQCAIDSSDFDTLLNGYIAAVRAHVEKILGRALVTQTWELRLPRFPCGTIGLARPPLQEVVSIGYLDQAGVAQTVPVDAYRVTGIGGDGYVSPIFGGHWPATRCMEEAVSVTFKAGYADGKVPADIGTAMLEMVADLFANRETVSTDQTYSIPIPATAKALLAPYRVWALP